MSNTVNRRWVSVIAVVASLWLVSSGAAWAQGASGSRGSIKDLVGRLPEPARQRLSSSLQTVIRLAERWDQIGARLRHLSPGLVVSPSSAGGKPGKPGGSTAVTVSNPGADLTYSSLGGFTQSETSTAWCGNNVVVGFNDSGSFLETFNQLYAFGLGGLSLNGFGRSTNKGSSFSDQGFLATELIDDLLGGDPVLGCADANTFYYASILFRGFALTTGSYTASDIGVATSTNGGASFGSPVPAVSKNSDHILDKPWMTVDPTKPTRLFVTYTDFDLSLTSARCGADVRTAIELVRFDGGAWSAPVVLAEVCGIDGVQGSQVAVGPGGEVYVAWETFSDPSSSTRSIAIAKSTDHGVTFGPAVTAAAVQFVGDGEHFQGGFRSGFEFPSLTVDRSGTVTNGTVYLTWNNGQDCVSDSLGSVPPLYPYCYADVLVSRSSDGATWSAPVRVNNNSEPIAGPFTDQFEPGIAVDPTGKVAVCFYDRREDLSNFLIGRWCATSTNGGSSWTNQRITTARWAAVPGQDLLLVQDYMGDYDNLASDFTGANTGFVGGWADNSRGNPDVMAARF